MRRREYRPGNKGPPYEKRAKGDPLTFARLDWLERLSFNRELSASELRLAIRLALAYAGASKSRVLFEERGRPVAYPSQATLAEELHLTRQAVSAAAHRLQKRGYLKINQGGGRGRATEYELAKNGKSAVCPSGTQKGQPDVHERANRANGKGKKQQQKGQASYLPQSIHSQSIDQIHSQSLRDGSVFSGGVRGVNGAKSRHPEFDLLTKLWPNRDIDRDKALGAWINNVVKRDVDPALVLKRAKQWCAIWEMSEKESVCYLGKWLKEERWKQKPPAMDNLGYFEMVHRAQKELAASDEQREQDDRWD